MEMPCEGTCFIPASSSFEDCFSGVRDILENQLSFKTEDLRSRLK